MGTVLIFRNEAETGRRRHERGLDKVLFYGIIAYVDSLYKSRPGHFAFRSSIVHQQDSIIKNEGPSYDVIENT